MMESTSDGMALHFIILIPSGFAASYMTEVHYFGVPAYRTPDEACRALGKLLSFHGL